MAVVVTGAAGFIGSHLVEALALRGYDVVGIDRRAGTPATARNEIIADLAGGSRAVRAALASADAVWHLAGCPGVRSSGRAIDARREVDNVIAGARVMDDTPSFVPLVVVSSSSVYGGARHGGCLRPSRESDALYPSGGYARSKAALEELARRRMAAGAKLTIARPFTVAGPRQRPDMAFAQWIDAARAGRPFTILGSHARSRDVTDVGDVVEGLIRIVERGAGGVFNLGSGVRRTLSEMVAAVCAVLGVQSAVEFHPALADEVDVTWASIERAQSALGYRPNTDLLDIIRRQVATEVLV
jgi:nucleoside-diphosphate-sugar epimerase